MLIGFTGYIGSGKDTAANYLVRDYAFKRDAFAGPVKDAAAVVFGWDRKMLEGDTPESRAWRDQKDEFWSKQLGWPVTARKVLQKMGTEAGREVFGRNVWSASLINRYESHAKRDTVVSDLRFFNEEEAIKQSGGYVIRIKRGEDPAWAQHLRQTYDAMYIDPKDWMDHHYPDIHESEWTIALLDPNYTVLNNGSLSDLYLNLQEVLLTIFTTV